MTASGSGRTTVTLQTGGRPQMPILEIDAATLEAWNRRYALEIGVVPTDEAELALLDELEQRGRSGYCWTEAGDDLEVGQPDWDGPAVRLAAGLKSASSQATGSPWLFWALVLGILLFFAGGMFWIFSSANQRGAGLAVGMPTDAGLALTAEGTSLPPTVAAPETPAVVGGDERVPVEPPRTLTLIRLGQTLTVVPANVVAGRPVWPPLTGPMQSVWIPSPVNWCLGIDAAWLKQLQVGDVLTAQMFTDRTLQFVVEGLPTIGRDQLDVLAQARAGLTLLPLAGDAGNQIRVAVARYDPTLEQPQTAPGDGVQPGTQITVEQSAGLSLLPVAVGPQPDGTYTVTVSGVITGSAGTLTPALEVAGQLFSARQALPADGPFQLNFDVPRLASAQLWLGADRLELGLLRAPVLRTQLLRAGLTPENTLQVDMTLTALYGAVAVRNGAFALLVPGKGSDAPQAVAPVDAPPGQVVTAGQTETVTLTFARPAADIKAVRLQTPAEAWDLVLP